MALKFASDHRERYEYNLAELCCDLTDPCQVFGGCSSSTPAVPTWLNKASRQWREFAK